MQLKKVGDISKALSVATCTLLGASPHPAAAASTDSEWEVESSILLYSEANDRVSAVEPVLSASKEIAEDEFVSIKLTLDALTGASPNGASPSDELQTFTRPSGKGQYQVAPGETPLDDTFRDTRLSLGVNWDKPLSRLSRRTYGVAVSKEYDYTSLGVSGLYSQDINQRNTTLQVGASIAADIIQPEGDIPVAYTSMEAARVGDASRDASDQKTTADLLFGVTQVLGHDSIAQRNYSYSVSNGYHTDPFKLLSVVDGVTGQTQDVVYENRPDSRSKHSIYGEFKHFLGRDLINASYRYYNDDWGVNSHTIELRYRWNLAEHYYLQPTVRWYGQSAADFYHHSLVAGQALPTNATADPRLAEFTALTTGLKLGYRAENGHLWTLRAEFYQQSGDDYPSDAIGLQKAMDLFPETEAYILQLGYDFTW